VLVERDRELAALDALLDRGGALVIEGGAGIGKTALAAEAAAAGRRRGWRVLRGCGSELETGFAFGVVRQLLERMLAGASPEQRAGLLAGPARPVAGLLAGPPGQAGELAAEDASFAIRHGLYWLIVHLAAGQPVLIIVDDAHWADEPSLRWLAYLATRLDGLGTALLVALRPAEAASRAGPLRAVRSAAAAVRPAVLTGNGVAVLARAARGEGVPGDQCAALRAASGGNPFYLSELLRATASAVPAGAQAGPAGLAGGAVVRHVEARIRRLDPGAAALAQALAVLGDGGRLRHAAAIAGLDMPAAIRLVAELVRVEVLAAADPPGFLHPIVRDAVEAAATSDQRDAAHRRAARELDRDGAAPGQVAAHLMRVHPAGDPWVVARLRQAARAAAQAGAPGPAGELLRRALAEPPPPADRLAVLGELAAADANAGRETALGWLEEALALTEDPRQRAAIAHEVARTYAALFRWAEAADVTSRALTELGDRDPELSAQLEAELAVAGMHDARRAALVAPAIARLTARPRPGTDAAAGAAGGRTAEALAVAQGMAALLTGRPADLAGGVLEAALAAAPPAAGNWDTRAALLWALITAERFGPVAAALPAMTHAATQAGSARGLIAVHSAAGLLNLRLGALPEADGAARVAVAVLRDGDFAAGLGVAAVAADIATESGELDEAEALLDLIPPGPPGVISVLVPAARGRLHLARGDGPRALSCFEACLAMLHPDMWGIGVREAGYLHARSGAAQALLLTGDQDRARALAQAELADAREFGGPRALGVALRAAGLAQDQAGGGLALLAESADVLRGSPARLERARSLTELGAALRRAGQRTAARPLLAEALDLASRCGARPLAGRAHDELIAAGGRPRRERQYGVAALTPSELRVARLAADGRTNREIARGLYVTPKTVETHLAHAYAKLGITGRAELAAALGRESAVLAGESSGCPPRGDQRAADRTVGSSD
jgi:DNA-binding CsgD family transcriptional regulator